MTRESIDTPFDLVCIGGGVGGLVAASGAAQLGARVALVEKTGSLGGDCLHHGCVPTKALVRAAKVASLVRRAGEFGIGAGEVAIDFPAVMRRMRAVQEGAGEADRPERFRGMGVEVVFGAGRFVSPRVLEVGPERRRLTARRFLVATGSRPVVLPIPGLAGARPLTNETILRLERLPSSLVVIGGGPIGLELAQVFGRLGTRVTVIEKMGQLLPREDKELADRLQEVLRGEGIEIHTSSDIERVDRANGACSVRVRSRDGRMATIDAEEVLAAIGRAPNVEDLGLEAAGVAVEKRGIVVDERMRTTARHIFAVGDVTGLFPFTHVAEHQAGVAIANALFPLVRQRANSRVVPWVTFTDPELARVGLSETEARERHGDSVRVHRFDMARFDRALIDGETRGLVKVVCTRRGEILGAHILAPGAGELLQEYVLAMSRGIRIGAIARTIHPYPTLVQAAKRAADQYYREKLFTGLAPRVSRALIGLGRILGRASDRAER